MSNFTRRWKRLLYRVGLAKPATGGTVNLNIHVPNTRAFDRNWLANIESLSDAVKRATSSPEVRRRIRDVAKQSCSLSREIARDIEQKRAVDAAMTPAGSLRKDSVGRVTSISDTWFTILPDDAVNPASRRSYKRDSICWSDMGNYTPRRGDRVRVSAYQGCGRTTHYVRLIERYDDMCEESYWAKIVYFDPWRIIWRRDEDGKEFVIPWNSVEEDWCVRRYAYRHPDRAKSRALWVHSNADGTYRVRWLYSKEEHDVCEKRKHGEYERVCLVAAWHYDGARENGKPIPRFELWRMTPAEKNGRTLRLYDRGEPAKGGQWHYDEAGARRRADFVMAWEQGREKQCLVEQVQTLEGEVYRLNRALVGCEITAAVDESHYIKEKEDKTMCTEDRCGTSIPQSDDAERVSFHLSPRYFAKASGARSNTCDFDTMLGVLSEAFRASRSRIRRMMEAHPEGFDLVCTPAQFGRFIAIRHERYKGTNGIKDLNPVLFTPEPEAPSVLDVTRGR